MLSLSAAHSDQARTRERLDPELLCALSDVYALPSQLRYARFVPLDERFTPGDTVHVFHAYIGALYREKGFEIIKAWIYEVLEWDNECVPSSPDLVIFLTDFASTQDDATFTT